LPRISLPRITLQHQIKSLTNTATALIVEEEVKKIEKEKDLKPFAGAAHGGRKAYAPGPAAKNASQITTKTATIVMIRNIQDTSHALIATLKGTKACVHEAARSLREEVQRLQPSWPKGIDGGEMNNAFIRKSTTAVRLVRLT
jgi:hypothetical protein